MRWSKEVVPVGSGNKLQHTLVLALACIGLVIHASLHNQRTPPGHVTSSELHVV